MAECAAEHLIGVDYSAVALEEARLAARGGVARRRVRTYGEGGLIMRQGRRKPNVDSARDVGPRNDDEASRNLVSINPFFIVEDLQTSVSYYVERLGFRLDFQGPDEDPYYGRVSRDGIGVMLKAILPEVLPRPNRARHEWARWDAYIYVVDPASLFDEFRGRGASFVSQLSFIDDGLWGFEVSDADGYVLAFAHLRDGQAALRRQ